MKRIDPMAFTERKHLLIFDLDGTLADTIAGIRDGVNLAMEKYGYPSRSYEEIRLAIGNGARLLIQRSMPKEVAENEKLVDRVLTDYDALYETTYANCEVYEGMRETLTTLKKRGYTLAVLSNKQDYYVKEMTWALFGKELFSFVAGQTDLPKKPNPTVPLMIAEQFGFSARECVFIGDSEVDVKTAQNAGMTAVSCSWGYRERDLLIAAGTQAGGDRPLELTELF